MDEQTSAPTTETFATTVERYNLEQRSDAASNARKAEITPKPEPEPQAVSGDLLDAIQASQTDITKNAAEFDRLREERKEPEKEAEAEAAPELPEELAQFDPEKVSEVTSKYGLTPEDLQNDPRWAALVEGELSQAEQAAQQQEQQPQTPEQVMRRHCAVRECDRRKSSQCAGSFSCGRNSCARIHRGRQQPHVAPFHC